MTGPLYHLGRFCSRRHWLVIGAWVLVAAALVVTARATGDKTSDNLTLPNTGSTDAQDLLPDHLPKQANGSNPLVFKAGSGKLTDSKNYQAVDETVKSLRSWMSSERRSALSARRARLLSKNKTIGYISVTLDRCAGRPHQGGVAGRRRRREPGREAGMKVATGGYLGQAVSKADTESSEAIGLAAAVMILLFAFGTATAMALPIVTAILGLVARWRSSSCSVTYRRANGGADARRR